MKSEVFVICIKDANTGNVRYAGLDSRNSFTKQNNPASLSKCFTREQAASLVKALKVKGLEEGISMKVKSIAQATRDFAYSLVLKANDTAVVDSDTMAAVLARFSKPAKAETSEPEAAPVEAAA